MTETEWLGCQNTDDMLGHLENGKTKPSEHRLLLFLCACWRRIGHRWHDIGDTLHWDIRRIVEDTEQLADRLPNDGCAASDALSFCLNRLESVTEHVATSDDCYRARMVEMFGEDILDELPAPRRTTWSKPTAVVANHAEVAAIYSDELHTEQKEQASLLRDLFGDPFRPVPLDSSWQTTTVRTLALQIYQELAFERMPELAYALQESGCSHSDILAHCCGSGPHVRGCWVIDLLLDKG